MRVSLAADCSVMAAPCIATSKKPNGTKAFSSQRCDKPPGSGEEDRNRWENLAHLAPHDEIKFVLADRADYEWAREVIRAQKLAQVCPILFSPVQGELPPAELAEWILADRLPVRMQVQLHKVLWGNKPGK